MKKPIFGLLILYITIYFNIQLLFAQSCTNVDELFRKRHTIQGMTYGHPYTTFDRHNTNYMNLPNAINNIRNNILKDKAISPIDSLRGPVYKAYQSIYINAISTKPSDNGMPDTKAVSPLAVWAKNNAFVFLVGLDSGTNYMDTTKYNGANYSSDSARNTFRDRSMESFNAIHIDLKSELSYMQGYSRSLIQWLQAYDLLKAAYEIRDELKLINPTINRYPWGFADDDRNKLDCSQRNKLRRATRELYTYSEGWLSITDHKYGWKKNHGIASASALLMAAQVLNDAGTETYYFNGIFGWLWGDGFVWPHPRYRPVKTII